MPFRLLALLSRCAFPTETRARLPAIHRDRRHQDNDECGVNFCYIGLQRTAAYLVLTPNCAARLYTTSVVPHNNNYAFIDNSQRHNNMTLSQAIWLVYRIGHYLGHTRVRHTPTDTVSDLLKVERVRSRNSLGSVVTFLRWGGKYNVDLGADLLQSPTVKEFLKSVNTH